jgi:hypothetical protein
VQIHDVAYNDDGIAASSVPQLEDFAFHDLRLTGRYYGADHHWYGCSSILLHGFDAQHPIQDILFEHSEILQQNDLPIEDIKYCINYHKQ